MTRNRQPHAVGMDRTSLRIHQMPEGDEDRATAEALSMPEVRAASIIQKFDDNLDLTSPAHELKRQTDAIQAGDMGRPQAMLTAQVHTLDALFSNLARRAQANMHSGHIESATTYMKLALKAQAQTVRTIEALGELKKPEAHSLRGAGQYQQVNNGNRSQAEKIENEQIKLSAEVNHELYQNTRTPSIAGTVNPAVKAVGEVHRSEYTEGKAKVSKNAYKGGLRRLLRALANELKKQRKMIEDL